MRIWNKGLIGVQEIKNRGKLYEMYKDRVNEISAMIVEANKSLTK